MLPIYVNVAATPIVLLMNNNCHVFNVSVRAAGGQVVEAALEDMADAKSPGPIWVAVAASPLGANFYSITVPVRLIRITGAGLATVLQQGI